MDLSTAQTEFFWSQGYLAIDRITSDDEISRLRELYDRILADPGPFSVKYGGGGVIHQVMSPDIQRPELRETAYFRNGRQLACQLLGIAEESVHGFFTHMIYKPARAGRDTPWHQDEAYWDEPTHLMHSVSVWMPLDPVTVDSGCMQFLAGSHKGDIRRYRRPAGIQPLLLDEDVDLSQAVACPLAAGGATFHHCRTLHYTGPNTSPEQRRAFALTFHARPSRRESAFPRPWLATPLA
jgi:ectoine hydroxylase-related dioxygenase (phytanoyl-CoA dioxygenase family)